ncbi:AAA family ATPase, partial [Knoellia aerolata]
GGGGPATVTDDELARWLDGPTRSGGFDGGPADAEHDAEHDPENDAEGDGLPARALVTAVWGPTGAPGRTTIAVALASHLAARGVRTLLVDLDTWGASVAQYLALIDEAPGVAAAARASEQGTLDLAALSRVAPEVTERLRVLTGIPTPSRWPELRTGAVEDILEQARGLVDHVVVDCGFALEDDEELSYDTAAPRRNATTLTALERSDSLVAVGAADPIGLQRLVRAVQDVGVVPSPVPTVVVNKVRASATGPRPERALADVLSRFAGLEDPIFVPWAPEECDAALLAGRSLVEQAPTAPVTAAVARIAESVRPGLASPGRAARRGRRTRLRRGSHRSA